MSTSKRLCPCKDRPASDCPGEWELGCDLGNNPKHARRVVTPGSMFGPPGTEVSIEVEQWPNLGGERAS